MRRVGAPTAAFLAASPELAAHPTGVARSTATGAGSLNPGSSPHTAKVVKTFKMRRPTSVILAVLGSFAVIAVAQANPVAPRSPLVGRWERVTSCQELVTNLKRAGLAVIAPYAWASQTSSTGEGSFKPGSPEPSMARPCSGAVPRLHSHFFGASGRFGSLDWRGGQVDDGPYRIVNSNTVRIGSSPGATFHFRILNGNRLMLTPVLTRAMIRKAVAHPRQFSTAFWAVSVAYAGHTWKRAPCSRCG
jgi:hypothetical protein